MHVELSIVYLTEHKYIVSTVYQHKCIEDLSYRDFNLMSFHSITVLRPGRVRNLPNLLVGNENWERRSLPICL